MEVVFFWGHFLDYKSYMAHDIDQIVGADRTYILGDPDEARLDHVKLILAQIGTIKKGN
jgi:hypothetical protein